MKKINLQIFVFISSVLFFSFGVRNQAFSQQNAVHFPGSTGSYVSVPDAAALNFSTSFTVEAWVYVSSISATSGSIITKGTGAGGEEYCLDIGGALPTVVRFFTRTGTSAFIATSTLTVSANTWTHLAGTWDGSNVYVWVNGVPSAPAACTVAPTSNSHVVSIGSRQSSNTTYDLTQNGNIDEVRIWNVARTQAQIWSDMYRELGTPYSPNLVAYYKFNSSSGITVTDLTGNGHTGSFVGSPTWVSSTAPIPFYTTASGSWATAGTWASGQNPPPSATYTDVIINNDVTLDAVKTLRNVTIQAGSLSDNGLQITSAGLLNLTGGTFRLGGTTIATTFPAFTAGKQISPGSTIEYAAGVAQAVPLTISYQNLTFSGAGIKTTDAGTLSVPGNWSVSGGAAALNTNNTNVTVTGNISGSGPITSGLGTIITVSGNLTNSGTFTASTGSVICNGAAQTVAPFTYYNLTLSGSGAKTFGTGPTISNFLSLEGTATVAVTSGAVGYGAGATLQYKTTNSRNAGVEWLNTFAATGGVRINGTSDITLNASKVFNAGVPLTIYPEARLTASATNSLSLGGNFNNNGIFVPNSGTVTFQGTTLLLYLMGNTRTTFYNLTINNTFGVQASYGANISNNLTFTSGNITTGSLTKITMAAGATVTGAGTGWVNGNMEWNFDATHLSKTFVIGAVIGALSSYTPVQIDITGLSSPGTVTAMSVNGDHPSINTSGIAPASSVNRHWTLTKNSGLAFTSYNATFTFVPG